MNDVNKLIFSYENTCLLRFKIRNYFSLSRFSTNLELKRVISKDKDFVDIFRSIFTISVFVPSKECKHCEIDDSSFKNGAAVRTVRKNQHFKFCIASE